MKLSRKWLNEFVDLSLEDVDDKAFAEAMTVSGSKVEVTEDLSAGMKNVKVGKILKLEKHPNSDHMLVCQLDVGEEAPVQICTGAWNVHEGDFVPAALHNSLLPGGVKITKGKLRGVESYGMLCSLKELELTVHDFDYAVIKPAAILGDYHPIDPAKPSISADIKAGDKIFGKVIAAAVKAVELAGVNRWRCALDYVAALQMLLTGQPRHAAAVLRARRDFNREKQLLKPQREENLRLTTLSPIPEQLPSSLLWLYHARRKHTFAQLLPFFKKG